MGNPVMHWQILSKDPERAESFYTELFGWTVAAKNSLGYRTVSTGSKEGIGGGIWPIAPNEGFSMVQLFIRVDDVKAFAAKAQELGGKVIIPPQKLPDGDEMAVLTDADGIPFGLMKGKS